MQIRRSQIALFVLLTFVVGSIMAPASHYAFMLFSDAYGIGAHHAHDSHTHTASNKHAAMHGHGSYAPQLVDADEEVYHCEYADLFATFAATGPINAAVADSTPQSGHLGTPTDLGPALSILVAYHQRGPPVFSNRA